MCPLPPWSAVVVVVVVPAYIALESARCPLRGSDAGTQRNHCRAEYRYLSSQKARNSRLSRAQLGFPCRPETDRGDSLEAAD